MARLRLTRLHAAQGAAKKDYRDKSVCRYYLEGMCPCDLFVNTVRCSARCGGATLSAAAEGADASRRGRGAQKMSLGECPNMHSAALRVRAPARLCLAAASLGNSHAFRRCFPPLRRRRTKRTKLPAKSTSSRTCGHVPIWRRRGFGSA